MRLTYIYLIFLGFNKLVRCEEESNPDPEPVQYEDDVMILTEKNFRSVISEKKSVLVEFYAPWCGHCQKLKPEFAEAAKELKDEGIALAMVDATVEEKLATTYEINGFPTLKFFKNGEFFENFEGERDAAGIVKYARERAAPGYKAPTSDVKSLTSANFKEFVDTHKLSLVEFYAPWCGHCKMLAPEYEKAASDLKKHDIPLAKVDATEENGLAKEHGVTGYPTLFIFRNGQSFEYKGPRYHAGIVNFMKEQAQPPSLNVKTLSEAKSKIPKNEIVVFAYFDGENSLYEGYIEATNDKREHNVFLHTFSSEIAGKYKLKLNTINIVMPEIYHSKFEDKMKTFSQDSASKSDIISWLNENSAPLVGERTHSNMGHRYTKRPLLVVYYDVNFSHQYIKATQIIRQKILPLAHKYRDISFAISDEEDYLQEIQSVGLEDSGEDVNVAIFAKDDLKYKLEPEDEFDENVLLDFILKFKSGKLKPYMKSQVIPKRQEGPVFTLVAKNFEKEVFESGNDFLIEFYAPWCGHCKKLEPIYKKVAKHFAGISKDIVVAKMDGTANSVLPIFSVKGFPTIYFVRADDSQHPVLYEGKERTFEALKKFVEEHSSVLSSTDKEEL